MSKNPAKVVQFKAEAAKANISVLDERPWSDAAVPLELVSKEFDSFAQDLVTCHPALRLEVMPAAERLWAGAFHFNFSMIHSCK